MSERLINEQTYENFIFSGFPVIPEKVVISYDDNMKKSLLQFYFISVTNLPVKEIHIKMLCFDENKKLVATIPEHKIPFSGSKNQSSKSTVNIDSEKVIASIEFVISKVLYNNKKVWINDDNSKGEPVEPAKPIDFPEHLQDYLINKEAISLRIQTECMFDEHNSYWRCSCKMLNDWKNKSCRSCEAKIETLRLAFSYEYLEQKYLNQKENTYNEAVALQFSSDINEIKNAIKIFESLSDYKESAEYIERCKERIKEEERKIQEAAAAAKKSKLKKLAGVIIALLILGAAGFYIAFINVIVPDREYQHALELAENGQYEEAYIAFGKMGTYKDSKSQKIKLFSEYIQSKQKGDIIHFGNGNWLILDTKGKKILVISEDTVGEKAYHSEYVDITWENCSLREYLNNDYYNRFSDEEKLFIAETEVSNPSNPNHKTDGGNNTVDKIYLLSISEAKTLLTDEQRIVSKWWWLRSPGRHPFDAAVVSEKGEIRNGGQYVNYMYGGLRPVMWLRTDNVLDENGDNE